MVCQVLSPGTEALVSFLKPLLTAPSRPQVIPFSSAVDSGRGNPKQGSHERLLSQREMCSEPYFWKMPLEASGG